MNTHTRPRHVLPRLRWPAGVYAALLASLAALTLLLAGFSTASASAEPEFRLPWQDGIYWQTGEAGFHGANDALDFFPPDTPLGGTLSCMWDPDWTLVESDYWILASTAGTVAEIGNAYVLLDHGNGWTSRYYHLSDPQVEVGETIAPGMRLGHPSTLGDCTTGPHVHFWVRGPAGETTYNVSLSGIPTTSISINQWIAETGNIDTAPNQTPTPTITPSPTPSPTPAPTFSPTPTPAPVAGDADCDGKLSPLDAMSILSFAAELPAGSCTHQTGDVTCDGQVNVADAAVVLQAAANGAQSIEACTQATATPTEDPMETLETPEPTPTATPYLSESRETPRIR